MEDDETPICSRFKSFPAWRTCSASFTRFEEQVQGYNLPSKQFNLCRRLHCWSGDWRESTASLASLHLYCDNTAILADTSMELRKWESSSHRLEQRYFHRDSCTNFIVVSDSIWVAYNYEVGTTGMMKVIGLIWDRTTDKTALSTQNVTTFLTSQKPTKRFMLQACSQPFGPSDYLHLLRFAQTHCFSRFG